jgi:acetolactate synthase-1/2/3 large subunit
MTNGAQALITAGRLRRGSLLRQPGTSEMVFVAALDTVPQMRVLCLFEGVVTGAADGYARIAGKPAATCCIGSRPG